jgi:hypothetical protein
VLLRRRHRKNSLILSASATGIIVGLLVSVSTGLAVAVTSTNTAQADSSSSVTLTAVANDMNGGVDAPMPNLAVTVSQTQGLLSQAVEISWTGGLQSSSPSSGVGGSNYLQFAQCWGEDPENPGHPDRTTCQYGGFGDKAAATRDASAECKLGPEPEVGDTPWLPPVVDEHDYKYTSGVDADYAKPCQRGLAPVTAIPFASATGGVISRVMPDPTITGGSGQRFAYQEYSAPGSATITIQRSGSPLVDGGIFGLPVTAKVGDTSAQVVGVNLADTPFYTKYTTNEVPWAGTASDGKGATKFEIQTAVQAPWLGCGTVTVDVATNVASTPQPCWLVVIPRGASDSGASAITKSGLWWDSWKHNMAFKLDFKPTAQRCAIGGTEKQLSGSELVSGAISSWQPNLCTGAAKSTFVFSTGNEAAALTKASSTIPSPLALTSRALQASGVDPVQYAPISISGLAIAFAVDKYAVPGIVPGKTTPREYIAKNTSPFNSMNLTPRLVAKLLTNSYWLSLPAADRRHIGYVDGSHTGNNAPSLVADKDFLTKQTGDEWDYQYLASISLSDLLVPKGQSDEANRLWEYALSDQEGRDFLSGEADEWGMKVNPFYSTVTNTYSAALPLPTVTFPKADPITVADTLKDSTQGNDSINLLTYRPLTANFSTGAYNALRGDGQILGSWNPAKKAYDKSPRELMGTQKVLAVTTTEAAARYHNVTASLRNPAGQFVAPTMESMTAAAAAMVPTSANAAVRSFDFSSSAAKDASGAYPLTMPVYAALNPLQTDAALRSTYANFIRFAVKDGQIPGVGVGQLPAGYSSIPQTWVDQAMVSANAIEQGISPQSLVAGTTVIQSAPSGAVAPRVTTTTSEDVSAPNPNPTATGAPAGALVGRPTPDDPILGPVAAAVPAGLLSGFAAAAAVPMFARFRRRP